MMCIDEKDGGTLYLPLMYKHSIFVFTWYNCIYHLDQHKNQSFLPFYRCGHCFLAFHTHIVESLMLYTR